MRRQADSTGGSGLPTVRTYGDLETIGPVNLRCSVEGRPPAEFTFHLFILPPQARYTVMSLGAPADVGGDGPLVRISSACIWAHLFGSVYCDCEDQLQAAKSLIVREGNGLIVYCHDHHGKGVGLRNHFIVYAEGQRHGQELVVDAYEKLGMREDYRSYEDVATILKCLRLRRCRLLTNSPTRVTALETLGIEVVRAALPIRVTPWNEEELTVKKTRLGHLIDLSRPHESGK